MSRAVATIRYDGPAVANHAMEVRDLAPSLIGLADLCNYANEIFNGSGASVRIVIRTDVEHKCFQLNFELIQTLYGHLTTFIGMTPVREAKEILEWIGIIKETAQSAGGLLGLFKTIYKSSEEEAPNRQYSSDATQTVEARAEGGSIIYQAIGDGAKIIVSEQVHRLATDPRVLPAVKRLLGPLDKDGYSQIEFIASGSVTQYFSREDAKSIIKATPDTIVIRSGHEHMSMIRTSVGIKKAMFEGNARWGIIYKKPIEAKIEDHQWLDDYQSGRIMLAPKWHLIVDLEERVPVDDDGNQIGEPTYAILKVHGVEAPPEQMRLPSLS